MKSITQLQPLLFPLQYSQPHCFFSTNIGTLRLINNNTLERLQSHHRRRRFSQARTKAVHDSSARVFLTLSSGPPRSPEDVTVFIFISALLFGMYWVSNFVVPDLLSKSFEYDKVKESTNNDDDDDEEDDMS